MDISVWRKLFIYSFVSLNNLTLQSVTLIEYPQELFYVVEYSPDKNDRRVEIIYSFDIITRFAACQNNTISLI